MQRPSRRHVHHKCREAAFQLDEYETARDAFQSAQQKGAPAAKCKTWLQRCQAELDGQPPPPPPSPSHYLTFVIVSMESS